MAILKLGFAYTRVFQLVTSAGVPVTGATVTVVISKAGAAFVSPAASPVQIANGFYSILLSTTDTGVVGDLAFYITATGGSGTALPLGFVDQVSTHVVSDITLDVNGNVSINSSIKQNQAINGFTFLMTNSTTHAPQTGLTVTAQRSLGGAGFAPCANAPTEISNGIYTINLAATDVNANTVMLRFTATAADDLDILLLTQP